MPNTTWQEFQLFCPVCNVTFKQLVVLHKVPKNFSIDSYLAGMVENHNHEAYQASRAVSGDAGEKTADQP